MAFKPKTLTPLLMLRILEEYSDEKHPLTRKEIERLLMEKYGITMERKAFFRHMHSIGAREDGEIHSHDDRIADVRRVLIEPSDPSKKPCAGFYLTDRPFTELELRIIIDALSGSHYLSQEETEELVKRLSGLGSRYFRKRMEAYQFIGRGGKTENRNLMLNLETIDEAITEGKQISFDILGITSQGKQVVTARPRVVCTPIRYFVKDRNYYLVVAKTVDEHLLQFSPNFREGDLQLEAYILADIDHVEKLDLPAQDYRSLPEFRQGMDWQKFLREHPTMELLWFKPELCTFLCQRDKIDDLQAHYSGDIRIRKLNDKELKNLSQVIGRQLIKDSFMEVSVITDRYDAAEFARLYHFGVWVISPKPARAIVRSLSVDQLKFYDKLEEYYVTGKKLPPLNLSYTPVNAVEEET